ncbi:hypothetical protein Tco_1270579, partial [Tanacetum coccineum]
VPQSSDPMENVADEGVYKELCDNLVVVPGAKKPWGILLLKLGLRMYLNIPMIHCSQKNEIASLKRRVKKLEKKNRSTTHRLKRLYKAGLTARVESSNNEESLGEDASKHGRIDVIDADEEITLENDEVNVIEEVVKVTNTAQLITNAAQDSATGNVVSTAGAATTVSAATTTTHDDGDITLAQSLIEMKSIKPKNKRVVIQELGESTITISSQLSSQQSQDNGKGILVEPVKPMKKKDQILLDEETALNYKLNLIKKKDLQERKLKKKKKPILP